MQALFEMNGKVVLITGSTGGIGRVTAEKLVGAGATVVLVGRNPQKAAQAARDIMASTAAQAGSNPVGRVEYLVGDLSVQSEVRRLAEEFRARYDQLHVLINNAGAMFMKRQISSDGIEMTFALNHLAYFLLTNLLLDRIVASAPARIINVSSGAHIASRLHLEDIRNPGRYQGWPAYSQSKLANLYFTYELARRLEGTGVTVNALHPGFVATNFGMSNGGLMKPLFRLFQMGAISPEDGAKTSVYLAASPEVEGVTGKYYDRSRPVSSSSVSYDVDMARRLWDASLAMTGLAKRA